MTQTKPLPHNGEGSSFPKNNPREVFGWKMYDWANSAFSTTIAGALFGPYLTAVAQSVVGDNGVVLNFGLYAITAKSFFPICIAVSVCLQFFFLPILGSIADYSHLKKKMMALFCYMGVSATCLMFFVTGSLYWLG